MQKEVTSKMPMVCIVVPVYNGERYLAECLDSLLAQTYRKISILVVDDGSTDGSAQIAASYSRQNPEVSLLTVEHGGLSHARNEGIFHSTEPYISFVDADDCLQPQAIEKLMKGILETDAKISACDFQRERTFRSQEFSACDMELLSYEQAMSKICYQKLMLNTANGKIYSREVFDGDCLFAKGILYEDLDACYRFLERTELLCYIPLPLYFYRQNPESLTNTWHPKRLDVLDVTDRLVEYMRQNHPGLLRAAEDRRFSAHYNMCLLMLANGVDNPEAMQRCWRVIRKGRWRALIDPYVRLKNKLGALLSFGGIPLIKSFARKE